MEPAAVLSATDGRAGRRRDEGGIALVAVLWVFILLSLVAASVASTTRTELRIARNMVSAAVAEAAADAAVIRAAMVLAAQRGRPGEWRTDGTPRILRIGDVDVTLTLQDEGGRIDLNAAGYDLLENALRAAAGPEAESLAAAIVDWRDGDDFVTPGGGEDGAYAGRGYPYGAKDAPFDSVDELRQVMGVTPQIYARIAPLFTVYSNSPGIDPAVAPRAVLLALPQFDAATVDDLMAARKRTAGGGQDRGGYGGADNGGRSGAFFRIAAQRLHHHRRSPLAGWRSLRPRGRRLPAPRWPTALSFPVLAAGADSGQFL